MEEKNENTVLGGMLDGTVAIALNRNVYAFMTVNIN